MLILYFENSTFDVIMINESIGSGQYFVCNRRVRVGSGRGRVTENRPVDISTCKYLS